MKIHGPGGPKPPTPDGAGKVEGADQAAGKVEGPDRAGRAGEAFADKLRGDGPGGPAAPGGPGAAGGRDPIADIAAELKAGRITPEEAIERVLDEAVGAVAAAGVPEAMRARLRAQLAELVGDDPFLAGKARRIGATGGDEGE